ncbi:MarR family transcriptional regulator [Propionimicrobium sp. PCR01-08-3]|uniref:MarR family winged helix-turn-helix transcriptional regulator n=1 Tax=Propionimicrobium sp. PCR01-08-3 TaxID=3052086 RepID=UPI00255C4FE9|nr:MarR family transcriptional regulator [Propionimicrobium sp. PCR01-08-3]WIY81782.1 MarR family transcriptional regulator [Propionimicrobium sp. PCR01-08-3]
MSERKPSDQRSSDDLGELFARVARKQRRATLAALEPYGVSPHQSRALRQIIALGPIRPSKLAECLHISMRSATEVVDALVGCGMLVREPDSSDRRAILVSATPLGVERSEQISKVRAEQGEAFLTRLTKADRAELRRILQILDEQ